MVYYRTYRPQTIEELDNKHVRETLTAVLQASLPHAFLFTGSKGLGKTSAARIIAKAINCENNMFSQNQEISSLRGGMTKQSTQRKKIAKDSSSPHNEEKSSTIEPCNECSQCLSIINGTNLDVIEIDAASNRGIDEIRELKEKIQLVPVRSRKKIYIIDEVHMLTTEAFNALLKTLEEPPGHAIFILCTTELHKIPATILSRCFHITFQPATVSELVRSFERIVIGEKLFISTEALQAIAELSDSGFRDGTKLLEEVVALSEGKKITKELVEEKLHIKGLRTSIDAVLQALSEKDAKNGLALVEQLVEQKVDMIFFLQKVLERLHEMLLEELEISHPGSHSVRLSGTMRGKQARMTLEEIQKLVPLFSYAYLATKQASIHQLPLELAVVEWCVDGGQRTEDRGSENNNVAVTIKNENIGVSVGTLRKKVGEIVKENALYGEKKVEVAENSMVMTSVSLLHFSKDGEITHEWLEAFWKSLISEMKIYNHTIAGVLRSCRISSFDRKSLVIEAAYQFHKDKLSEPKTILSLEQVCATLMGNPVLVTVTLKNK